MPAKSILRVLNAMVPAAVIIYAILYYPHHVASMYVIALFGAILAISLYTLIRHNRLNRILFTASSIFTITYISLEIVTYVLLCCGVIRADMQFFFRGVQATDRPMVAYDSICGFRGQPGVTRYISGENGKFEIDILRSANSKGWFSRRKYDFRKKNQTVHRYMVFGDSYSSGFSTSETWVDRVQDILQKKDSNIELYNFSLEGSGLINWYRTFVYEVEPKYEYDGIIIASSSEKSAFSDLDRKFIMMDTHAGDGLYLSVATPDSIPARFPVETAPRLIPVYDDATIDRIKSTYSRSASQDRYVRAFKPDLWFLSIMYGVTDGIMKMLELYENSKVYSAPYENYYKLADSTYTMAYFDARYKYGYMLKKMIAQCQEQSKDVILVNIPDYENAIDFIHGRPVICRNELSFLSQHYGTNYFDGFNMMQGRDSLFVDSLFFQYDRHWTDKGVQLFAARFADTLVSYRRENITNLGRRKDP